MIVPHLLKCLPVHSQVTGLGRRLQLVCLFIYYLFINHKSRKDLRRLTIKDTNTVKLLKQNTAWKATLNGEGGTSIKFRAEHRRRTGVALRVLAAPGQGCRDAQSCCLSVATASGPERGRGLAGRWGLGTGILFQGLGCPAMRSEGQSGGLGQLCRDSLRSSCALPGALGRVAWDAPHFSAPQFLSHQMVLRIRTRLGRLLWGLNVARDLALGKRSCCESDPCGLIPLMNVVLGRSSPRPPGSEGAPLEGVAGRGAPACPRLVRTDAVHTEPGLFIIAYKHLRSSEQREHTF